MDGPLSGDDRLIALERALDEVSRELVAERARRAEAEGTLAQLFESHRSLVRQIGKALESTGAILTRAGRTEG